MSKFAIPFIIAFSITVIAFACYNSSPSPLSTGSGVVIFGFSFLVSLGLLLIVRKTRQKKE